jgi:hypothetical protein
VKTFDEAAVVALGKAQVEALFRRQETPGLMLDDRDFIPLLEAVVSAFEAMGLSPASVEVVWDHAYNVYDQLCRTADPSFSFEDNRELMRRHLVGPRRSAAGKTKKRSRLPTNPRRGIGHD